MSSEINITHSSLTEKKSYRPMDCNNVSLYNTRGSIGIKFVCPIKSKQKEFSVGKLKWLNLNDHRIAKLKALQLDNDLRSGLYDGDVSKYKVNAQYTNKKVTVPKIEPTEPTLKQIWEYYKENKQHLAHSTKLNWKVNDKYLIDCSCSNVLEYVEYLRSFLALGSIIRPLDDINSALNLAIKHKKIKDNPLVDILNDLKKQRKPKKKNKTYSIVEIEHILNAFKNDTYVHKNSNSNHSKWYYFVAFRLLTGCRPSEAIALTWNDIKQRNGKTYVVFDKAYVKGKLQPQTKTKIDRLFNCNDKLKQLIESIPKRDDRLVFPNTKGNDYINGGWFNRRVWSQVTKGLVKDELIDEHLPFYDIRHTFCTHLCRSGAVDLPTIASLVGNSVPTLINNYLATDESIELPDLF